MLLRKKKEIEGFFSNKKALILISFEIYIVCWGIARVVNQYDYLIFHTHTHTHTIAEK